MNISGTIEDLTSAKQQQTIDLLLSLGSLSTNPEHQPTIQLTPGSVQVHFSAPVATEAEAVAAAYTLERDDGLAAGFTLLAVGAWMALITWTFVRVFHKRLLFLIFANNDVRTNDASHATKDAEVSLSKTATVTTTTQTATETTIQIA
ncbi:hypothetical protein Ctob_009613 [Chrysochromulina tobinii]|uniref:Uncharacterized protein n=1 Tax=Chrysochromulina tobinii TaxID=1460289 RepID=A0A0M0LS01_9EUKA|nr:hypothetical protein Ctob_009613 [Chrysochromulina tobinii]|eukprot:KOO53766.1 hypothetical protein Ctob_009613 [Chrysochromulina sp. CCMP291]